MGFSVSCHASTPGCEEKTALSALSCQDACLLGPAHFSRELHELAAVQYQPAVLATREDAAHGALFEARGRNVVKG